MSYTGKGDLGKGNVPFTDEELRIAQSMGISPEELLSMVTPSASPQDGFSTLPVLSSASQRQRQITGEERKKLIERFSPEERRLFDTLTPPHQESFLAHKQKMQKEEEKFKRLVRGGSTKSRLLAGGESSGRKTTKSSKLLLTNQNLALDGPSIDKLPAIEEEVGRTRSKSQVETLVSRLKINGGLRRKGENGDGGGDRQVLFGKSFSAALLNEDNKLGKA